MRTLKRCLVLVTLLSFNSFFVTVPGEKPRLVLYISIDQFRGDYLERFKPEFTGAFHRLATEGALFTNADLNYAISETGPGHATLGTGTYPGKSGIVSNEWIDRRTGKEIYCVDDSLAKPVEGSGGGFSPRNLLVTGLGDWLKAASPQSKVISLSHKDRAAILMAGKQPDGAFWYDRKSCRFVTSSYYTRRLPGYVRSFNASDWIEKSVPPSWEKLMPDSVYTRHGPDEMEGEGGWEDKSSFPHRFDQKQIKEQFLRSPYADLLLLDFAREVIKTEGLGQRGTTDLLCICLSGCDYIGHDFGPDSHEMLDYLLRIDQALGTLLDDVEGIVGKNQVLVAVSADHAVQPLPEFARRKGNTGSTRILLERDLLPRVASLDSALQVELGIHESLVQQQAFLNYDAAARVGVDSLAFERKIRKGLLGIDGIEEVYFRRDLRLEAELALYAGRYQRCYYAPRAKDIYVRFRENCLIMSSPTGTSHGTPYRYDTHVGLAFWGAGIRPQTVAREVHTVDIAPTLARRLGIPYPPTVDGAPLKEVSD